MHPSTMSQIIDSYRRPAPIRQRRAPGRRRSGIHQLGVATTIAVVTWVGGVLAVL